MQLLGYGEPGCRETPKINMHISKTMQSRPLSMSRAWSRLSYMQLIIRNLYIVSLTGADATNQITPTPVDKPLLLNLIMHHLI